MFAGVVVLLSVHEDYVKKGDLTGSCYCLIIVCFGTASGVLREVSEGLPKPFRSRHVSNNTKTRKIPQKSALFCACPPSQNGKKINFT